MCRELVNLGIDVVIYLPQEHEVKPEWLRADYLLKDA